MHEPETLRPVPSGPPYCTAGSHAATPENASVAVKPIAKAWLYQPFASAPRSGTAVTAGAVLSILIVTDRFAVSPALLRAVQVSVLPVVSAVTLPRAQFVRLAIPDSGSRAVQRIATSLTYQPFAPAVPVSCTVITGGVVSVTAAPAAAAPSTRAPAVAAPSVLNPSFRVLVTIHLLGRGSADGPNGAIPTFDACKANPAF